MTTKIAVVTGANKGIGYAAAKGLAKIYNGIVYLTARNVSLGQTALEQMRKELGSSLQNRVRFHQMDLTDIDSITKFRDFLLKEHGGLDVLINNAGIAFTGSTAPFAYQVEQTSRTNYYGTKSVCHILFPILRPNARVVTVVGRLGCLSRAYSSEIRNRMKSPSLTEKELDAIVDQFVAAAQKGTHEKEGFPNAPLGVSKCAEIALTRMQKNQVSSGITVNCFCPGYVDTDMSEHKGMKTPEQGADTSIYLATIPPGPDAPNGLFFAERRVIDWETGAPV